MKTRVNKYRKATPNTRDLSKVKTMMKNIKIVEIFACLGEENDLIIKRIYSRRDKCLVFVTIHTKVENEN